MSSIWTLDGLVETDDIGATVLAHEHLYVDLRTEDDRVATLTDTDAVVKELTECKRRYGLGLVVDLSCRGMGRSANTAHQISTRAEVPVVAATGYYYEKFHPAEVAGADPDFLCDLLVTEIRGGLDGTSLRPGVLGEIGSHGPEPTQAEHSSLLAAGRAAVITGLSVGTHAHLGQGGLGQLELLASTGLSPERVSIGHQDLLDDTATHQEIAASGAYVAFDTVGKDSYQPDEVRLRLILALLENGYASKILLSNDISRDAYLIMRGGQGYGYVLGGFADRLRDAGVDDATLRLLYRDNALRWLTAGVPCRS